MSLGSLLLLWKQWETIAQGAKGVTMGIKREVQSEMFFFLLEFILRDFCTVYLDHFLYNSSPTLSTSLPYFHILLF